MEEFNSDQKLRFADMKAFSHIAQLRICFCSTVHLIKIKINKCTDILFIKLEKEQRKIIQVGKLYTCENNLLNKFNFIYAL